MNFPRSSLASQIHAVRYEISRHSPRKEFWSANVRDLHREHLADALASLCWLNANRSWIIKVADARGVDREELNIMSASSYD